MQDPIYGYSKIHSSSFSAFKNTCEYACALDIQEKKLGYGKLIQYILYAGIAVGIYFVFKGNV